MSMYEENFCRAVDTIIAERLKELTFDKTINCTILELVDAKEGKYYVSNGTSKFYAYVNDDKTSYRKNTSVQVLIPEGNFNNKKLIIGKATENSETSWQSAVNQFLSISTVSIDTNDDGITANGSEKEKFISQKDVMIPAEATALCISADFKTSFFDLSNTTDKMIQGHYGLKMCLKTETKDYWLELANSDMIGSIYNFGVYLTQSKIFDIIQIQEPILQIQIYLYQDGEFIYEYQDENSGLIQEKYPLNIDAENYDINNIFINNIQIKAGYPSQTYSSSGLEVYSLADSTYAEDQSEEELKRTLQAKWTKNFDDKMISVEDSDKLGANELIWYQQINDSENWEEMSRNLINNFSISINLNPENYVQKYKAKIVNIDNEEIESNIFQFKKSITVKNDLKISLLQAIGSEEPYAFENVNNFINNYSVTNINEFQNLFKVQIEYRGYDGKKKNVENNYSLIIETLGDSLTVETLDNPSKTKKFNHILFNIENGVLISEPVKVNVDDYKKIHIYKITLKTSVATYEKIFCFGYKAASYSINSMIYYGYNLMSNLDFSNNQIIYDKYGSLKEYFSNTLELYNLNNIINNIDITSTDNNFINQISINENKLSPSYTFIWGGNSFGQINYYYENTLLYTIPVLMEQSEYSTSAESEWEVKHVTNTYQMNKFSSNFGFGEKNSDGTFSGVYFGKYNQDQGLFSIEDGKLNLYIGPSGTSFGGWKICGDEYSTAYDVQYPARYTGAFFGLRKATPQDAFYFSEKGLEAWGVAGRQYYTAYFNSVFGVYQKTQYNSTTGIYGPGGSYYVDIVNLTFSEASDRRIKTNFQLFNNKFEKFYDTLQPCCYNLKTSLNKISNGFIAQDVLESFENIGINKNNQTLVKEDEKGLLSLSYTEFIPLNTWQIQKLKSRVSDLEQEVQELKTIIKEKMEI